MKKDVPKLKEKQIHEVFTAFVGDYYQTPPMYSAKKVKGKKLYEYARKNIVIDRNPVLVKIHSINLENFNGESISFSVACSKGTYIRVLGKDIAEKLETVGYLNMLTRTAVGEFKINESLSITDFEIEWKSSTQKRI